MGKSTWRGSVSFGLVNIPVELHTAVRDNDKPSFRMLHKGCNGGIKYDRVCETHKVAVPWDDIVKGYEHQKGQFVVLDSEDFAAAAVESSRTVVINEFVPAKKVDPRYFEKPHFLLPQAGAERGYALVRNAIAATDTVGIGLLTMRANAQHIVGIKAVGKALMIDTMRFSEGLVPVNDFKFPDMELKPQEQELAMQLISSMVEDFEPDKYANTYRDNLMGIIAAKVAGKALPTKVAIESAPTSIPDLIAMLTQSLTLTKRST